MLIESKLQRDYKNLIESFSLHVNNNDATRVTSSTKICIDHRLSRDYIKKTTHESSISDHDVLLVDTGLGELHPTKKKRLLTFGI